MSALGRELMPLPSSLLRARLPPAFPSLSWCQATTYIWDSGFAIILRLCVDWGPGRMRRGLARALSALCSQAGPPSSGARPGGQ